MKIEILVYSEFSRPNGQQREDQTKRKERQVFILCVGTGKVGNHGSDGISNYNWIWEGFPEVFKRNMKRWT